MKKETSFPKLLFLICNKKGEDIEAHFISKSNDRAVYRLYQDDKNKGEVSYTLEEVNTMIEEERAYI